MKKETVKTDRGEDKLETAGETEAIEFGADYTPPGAAWPGWGTFVAGPDWVAAV